MASPRRTGSCLGAPVGQYRLVVLAGQADAAYVPALALHVIESTEHQTVFHGAQLGEPVLVHGGERVAFRALGGGRASRPHVPYPTACASAIAGRPSGRMRGRPLAVPRAVALIIPALMSVLSVKTQAFKCSARAIRSRVDVSCRNGAPKRLWRIRIKTMWKNHFVGICGEKWGTVVDWCIRIHG